MHFHKDIIYYEEKTTTSVIMQNSKVIILIYLANRILGNVTGLGDSLDRDIGLSNHGKSL